MRHEEMASGEGVSCDEDTEMNFAFTTAGGGGAQFITTSSGQVAKLQQNVGANGTTLSQVVGMVGGVNMGDGVQYMRTLDGGATIHATPQLITLPIALPGAKPGDPQQTVQIQVLSPNITLQQQQQQPKYHMQIPIQGFQQGGAVLTLAYAPEGSEGMQILNNQLPEGFQVVQIPQEMQLTQNQDTKEQLQQALQQQILAAQQQHQIVLNNNSDDKSNHNLESEEIIIKEECNIEEDNIQDDEISQGAENTNDTNWQNNGGQDLVNYFNRLPQQLQQTQSLPVSLQQFLILNSNNSGERKLDEKPVIQIEITQEMLDNRAKDDESGASSEGQVAEESPKTKRKKKYKKKTPKPAKPKPGQIVITTSNDGTVIYCCPECHMAYSEKEQLEMHLAVHKIERRFICGICGAGLKRKEHLERHKLGHNPERPYVCLVCRKGFKRREHLNLHTVIHTGVKTEICPDCGKGFYRKDHLRKHTRSHETRRAREDVMKTETTPDANQNNAPTNEITIHVPTSSNMQVPIQINIPQHVVSSLTSQQGTQLTCNQQSQLDALLAQHT